MNYKFKIGQEVILNKNANAHYSITTEGSKGIIESWKNNTNEYDVDISFIPDDYKQAFRGVFPIREDCLTLPLLTLMLEELL